MQQWSKKWKECDKRRELFQIGSIPRKEVPKLHDKLSKELSTLAVQMRMAKMGFNRFLFRRRVPGIDSPRCQYRQSEQTVEHVLLACRKF